MKQKSLLLMRLLVLFCAVLTSSLATAQDRVLSGKITDEEGKPLPGATIQIRGTSRGATSNTDGAFRIEALPGKTLVVRMLGMQTKEILLGNQSTLDVTLVSADGQLDEVVVTALGIKQERRSLGYAVQDVKGQDLADTQRENFLTSLQGRVAGLNMSTTSGLPGSSVQITLRGVNSIGGNNSPLFVVDGLPISNNTFGQGGLVSDQPNRNNDYLNRAADINPNDIESITVLKGPEAAALYGIDAAAGAIIITTKKGKAGKSNFTYDNVFRFDQVYRFPEFQQEFGRGSLGVPSPGATSYFGARFGANEPRFNNFQNFFKTGKTQRHNLSVDGGTEKISYRYSASYTSTDGIVPTTTFENLTTRLNLTAKVSKFLEISPSLQYTSVQTTKPIGGATGYYINSLLWPSNDDARNYLNADGSRRRVISDATSEPDNPFFHLYKNANSDRTNRAIGRIQMVLTPAKWLSIASTGGIDTYTTIGNSFLHPETNDGIGARGRVENYTETGRLYSGNTLVTGKYSNKTFNASLMVGGQIEDNNYQVDANLGERLFIPDFNSINNTDPLTKNAKLTITQRRVVSAMSTLNLGYRDMLYLNVTARNDWTSTMPIANRSFFYPSVSGGFVFTELLGGKVRQILDYGKLRASFARVGKDAAPYRIQSALASQTTTGGGYAYGVFGGNPDLVPEFGESYEVGAEFKLFKGRLGADIAYYDTRRLNQIVSQRLSYGTGFVLALLNGGSFSTKGLELQITGKPIKTKNFTWDVIANYTQYRTAVLTLPAQNVPEYYNSDTWLVGNVRASAFVPDVRRFFPEFALPEAPRGAGSALAIGGYDYLRNNKGQILINPGSGLPIINANFVPIGDRTPDFTVGLTNTFTYKGLSLNFLLDFRKGGDVFNGNEYFLYVRGLSKNTLNRETPTIYNGVLRDGRENSDNPTPNNIQITPMTRVDYYSNIAESDFIERDINWVRLRDVTLRYVLPSDLVKRSRAFKSASVFVTGTDLFLLTNYTGADPNVNGTTATTQGSGAAGFDFGKVAVPRGLSFGVRVGL